MAWKGYAPLGKSKTIPTPDVSKDGGNVGSKLLNKTVI